jgi:hypothetical protein
MNSNPVLYNLKENAREAIRYKSINACSVPFLSRGLKIFITLVLNSQGCSQSSINLEIIGKE